MKEDVLAVLSSDGLTLICWEKREDTSEITSSLARVLSLEPICGLMFWVYIVQKSAGRFERRHFEQQVWVRTY